MDKVTYTVPEVARRLQVTQRTVRGWISDKKISAVKIGREWRFREQDIQEFMERHLSTANLEIHGVGD